MNKDYLGKLVKVKIDRPLGSKHPDYNYVYPINYGYIEGTISGDGEELDAYILGENRSVEEFSGRVIAIIHRTNDNDDKLVVAKDGQNYSDYQIRVLTHFQEKWFQSEIWR